MTDLIQALVAHLSQQQGVVDFVLDGQKMHVYGLELPASVATDMPRKALVLQMAGGVGPVGARDFVPIQYMRVDAFCYGETGFEATRLQRAVHDALKGLSNAVAGDTLIRSVSIDSGPRYFKDSDTDWPTVIESYSVMASECELAA